MKRTQLPASTTPLQRKTPLGGRSKFGNAPKPAARKRPKNTGPSSKVRTLVAKRSGGLCESATCFQAATDLHHRLNRKAGGRHGVMADLINQAAWLLHACRTHHDAVTSPHGEARSRAIATGWLLLEGQDARHVPVVSRHGRVYLTDDGGVSNTAPAIFPTAEG